MNIHYCSRYNRYVFQKSINGVKFKKIFRTEIEAIKYKDLFYKTLLSTDVSNKITN